MPVKSLPSNPSLDHLKHQAKDLLRALKQGDASALARLREFHPQFSEGGAADSREKNFSLSDAQFVIAREYGFESWPRLKQFVEASTPRTASNDADGKAP